MAIEDNSMNAAVVTAATTHQVPVDLTAIRHMLIDSQLALSWLHAWLDLLTIPRLVTHAQLVNYVFPSRQYCNSHLNNHPYP